MKTYTLLKRKGREYYYIENNQTGEQRSLGTKDIEKAETLVDAANEARRAPELNMQMGKMYISTGVKEISRLTELCVVCLISQ